MNNHINIRTIPADDEPLIEAIIERLEVIGCQSSREAVYKGISRQKNSNDARAMLLRLTASNDATAKVWWAAQDAAGPRLIAVGDTGAELLEKLEPEIPEWVKRAASTDDDALIEAIAEEYELLADTQGTIRVYR